MKRNKYYSLLLYSVLILGVVESFDYHEKELETEESFQGMYDRWRNHHKVEQNSPERFNVFQYNVQSVHETNKMNNPYKLKVNEFADMTNHEFTKKYANSKISHYHALQGIRKGNVSFIHEHATNLPSRIDWREHNAVTHVKTQGPCGACWAFSAVAAVEGINAIRTGRLLQLSEQQLIDCAHNKGCDGGLMTLGFSFIKEHGGLATEESYPYKGAKKTCDETKLGHHAVTLDGYEHLPPNNEDALMKAVAHQPVAAGIDIRGQDFQFYSHGVFTGQCGTECNHGVAIVGYDETPGFKYWIVKNSWGERWGDKGYILLQRGLPHKDGQCGIARNPSIPVKNPNTANIEI